MNGLDVLLLGGKKLEHQVDSLSKMEPKVASAVAMGHALVYERGMKRRAPVGRTGGLRNSIKAKATGPGMAEVGPHQKYAAFPEYGTGLFVEEGKGSGQRIKPIHASALSWMSYSGRGLKGGARVTVKSIAGMKATPYVRPTMHEDKAAAAKGGQLAGKMTILKAVKV